MAQYQFKTNIKCGGCIAAVKPFLDGNTKIENWAVDTTHPDKILTVETALSETAVVEVVKAAGYQAVGL